MANTLTAGLPNMTTAMQRVAKEMAPLPRLATTDFKSDMAALNEAVTIPIAPTVVGGDRTPAAQFTAGADRTLGSTSITITKDRTFAFHMTGDDFARMRQNPDWIPASFEQALRTWRNEVHSDLVGLGIYAAGYYSATAGASGAAFGTAGTTPFASDYDILVDASKALNDSLAPLDGRVFVPDTAAYAALNKLDILVKANESGSAEALRNGFVGRLAGFDVSPANVVPRPAIGTGSGYLVDNGGGYAAGVSTIHVDTGTGTIVAGDVVSFGAGTDNYVVLTGFAGNGDGDIVLSSPLVAAIADDAALVIKAQSRRNMAFHRDALGLAIRLPKLPLEGDMGEHSTLIDPDTGIGLRVSTYKGYGLNNYELSSAWGVKALRPELLKIILG
jgi:hypothetical protein